ncbi:MAG: hypothetical protein JJ992_13515, partial [Planctomycetes bacterium]|nr:hypothetical protein [Planctomycetota bacterium]
FLGATAAICRGRGEQLEPLYNVGRFWLVIVRPPAGLSTAEVYRDCRPALAAGQPSGVGGRGHDTGTGNESQTLGRRSVSGLQHAISRGEWSEVGRRLFNRLQPTAERHSPWIARLREVFDLTDCVGHQMSGSGSSYFGICRHAGHARSVAGRLLAADVGAVFVTATQKIGPLPRANHFMEERHGYHRGSHQAHGE